MLESRGLRAAETMSTRWVLGKTEGHSDQWMGRYVHNCGQATAAGPVVWKLVKQLGVDGVLAHVLDAHPEGWSWLDPAAPAAPAHAPAEAAGQHKLGHCYCHDGRPDQRRGKDWWVTSDDTETWCDWAYILNPETHTLHIFRSYSVVPLHHRRLETRWAYVIGLNIDGEEPEPSQWSAIEQIAELKADAAHAKAKAEAQAEAQEREGS